GFSFGATSGLVTNENGATATFTVVLTSQPLADVTFTLSSSDTTEGTVSPTTLTFTSAPGVNAWNALHTVTVTGVDDAIPDGPTVHNMVPTLPALAHPAYNLKVVPDVDVINNDNDTVGITVTPTSGLTTSEAGGTATFAVVLNTMPAGNATISVTTLN